MNSGVELWNKAKKIIPGGNQLLSKRSEMFLPEKWPSYYKKAKGVAYFPQVKFTISGYFYSA